MVKGSTLENQIYKEGTPTWGCKSGVLDVEDVKQSIKEFIEEVKEEILKEIPKGCMPTRNIIDRLDKMAKRKFLK